MPPEEPDDGIDVLRLQRFFCLNSTSCGIAIKTEVFQRPADVNREIVRRNN